MGYLKTNFFFIIISQILQKKEPSRRNQKQMDMCMIFIMPMIILVSLVICECFVNHFPKSVYFITYIPTTRFAYTKDRVCFSFSLKLNSLWKGLLNYNIIIGLQDCNFFWTGTRKLFLRLNSLTPESD